MPFTRHGTLTANVVTTIAVTGSFNAGIAVSARDDGPEVWFTLDGSDPVPEGDDTYHLPTIIWQRVVGQAGATTVKLLSIGARQYSVEVV